MKSESKKLLVLEKFKISKLGNLNLIKGGNGTNSGDEWTDPTKSGQGS